MVKKKVALTTLQKKAYIYLEEARKKLGISDCRPITLLDAATVVDASKMAVVASSLPTIGGPQSNTYKLFSRLVDIQGDAFDLAVNFFKLQLEKDLADPTDIDILLTPLSDKINNYWNTSMEDLESLEGIYKTAKFVASDLTDINTIGAWSSNLFEKVAPMQAKLLKGKANKEAFMKAIGNLTPLKSGDYWLSGASGIGFDPQKIYKVARKSTGRLWFSAQQVFAADDIYKDYKNESYANMAMRIMSAALGYSQAPQIQALGASLGLTRWAVDEYSKVFGKLIAKNFDQSKRTKAKRVDAWLVDAEICDTQVTDEVFDGSDIDFKDRIRISREEYNTQRIISPFINAALEASDLEANNQVFNLLSAELERFIVRTAGGGNPRVNLLNVPSYDFIEVDGSFTMDNRVTDALTGFLDGGIEGIWINGIEGITSPNIYTDGNGWIYEFPDGLFNLRSDFKGARSDDLVMFDLQMPGRNSSGRLPLSATPQKYNLTGSQILYRDEELGNYETFNGVEYIHKIPFELMVTSLSGVELGAEVNGKFYDLGKTETIAGFFTVINPPVPT